VLTHNCLGPSLAGVPGVQGWGVTPLSLLKHARQLLLTQFFDLMKFEFDPQGPLSAPQGSEGDPIWIFVISETYLTTFVSKIFWRDAIWFWPSREPPSDPGPPGVKGQIRIAFSKLSGMKTLPYQFCWATISGFRDHSRMMELRTDRNQRVNIYLIGMKIT
jgi:hypothetical protein